jgi:hypothetical protein
LDTGVLLTIVGDSIAEGPDAVLVVVVAGFDVAAAEEGATVSPPPPQAARAKDRAANQGI